MNNRLKYEVLNDSFAGLPEGHAEFQVELLGHSNADVSVSWEEDKNGNRTGYVTPSSFRIHTPVDATRYANTIAEAGAYLARVLSKEHTPPAYPGVTY